MPIDHDMRVRFHAALADKDKILAKTADLHKQASDLAAQAHALLDRREALIAKIRDIEAPALELQREMAVICRALKNQTALPEHQS